MKKVLIYLLVFIGVLLIGGLIFREVMITQTKKHSPQVEEVYHSNGINISINYSSPFKKGRVIFGNLVPYGHVWRTGANEPTTFMTNVPLDIQGQRLAPGRYSIWTIPESKEWTVIFNKKINDWGVSLGGKASRNPDDDVLQVVVPTEHLRNVVESFMIDVKAAEESNKMYLRFEWDNVGVQLLLKEAK
ncbi:MULTISPECIES: DUF2911 domain-containing protein [Flammeovirga]|uniref:DUF2911 domain-containing protein n=1 Tax=Flammeovirga agarivorans TaxID=2726742 RepID=A0A7X8XU19_9BACT|nr:MULTISPECIES: DUF2911 domain-containing protein [Flammeovirga]NLR89913.1 DUF2911 domain-containing protein [Flammeovirga agarivorans]